MLFNSPSFLVFFAVVMAVWRAPLPWAAKKALLLVGSWFFYGASKPVYVPLLIASSAVNWALALAVESAPTARARRLRVAAAVALDLGLLVALKYGRFVLDNAAAIVGACGGDWTPPEFDAPNPVGISFFTFQALSYVVDVGRGDLPACRSFADFALYVAYFPQLVAGPIVRASDLLSQFDREPPPSAAKFDRGAALAIFGLFQKAVLADAVLAPVADLVFAPGARPGFVAAWAGALAFTGQIYCDFAGYSTVAIGVALMMGFELAPNFRRPYAASTFSDFWRRWHVSLSTWLRDYLYRPLGGDRRGRGRTYFNLCAVMVLGGLWHGAAWTFVAWGALHGVLLAAERALGARRTPDGRVAGLVRWAVTLLGVVVGWVLFRAGDFASAVAVLRGMSGLADAAPVGLDRLPATAAGLVALALILHHRLRPEPPDAAAFDRIPRARLAAALALSLVAVVVFGRPDRAFIYFRF